MFLIILLVALVGGYGGWVAWSRIRASRLGLPPPSLNPFARGGGGSAASNYPGPAPTGIKGWIDTQIRKFKNRNNRYATGAYEESSGYAAAGTRGRGAGHRLDPDEAWDARVGNETYYEEQELGLHEPPRGGLAPSANPYETTHYGAPSPGLAEPQRGRSRTREYDEHSDGHGARQNPFGDEHAASLRGVSPRPLDHHHVDTSYGGASGAHKKKGSADNSPTESRRSVFHEEM